MKFLYYFLILLFYTSCDKGQDSHDANKIVDIAIENAGGKNYDTANIKFTYRDNQYQSSRNFGNFQLERVQVDSAGIKFHDILNNKGFQRYRNNENIPVIDSAKIQYSAAINSVLYFVQLPYGLNAESVKKEFIGKDSIKNKEYFEIKVSFSEKGGGSDNEDEYLYWINTEDYKVDYLAYKFKVNGGGIRFRSAFNERFIGGIRFVDYANYKTDELSTLLHDVDSLFEDGKLIYVSTIITENIKVKINN